MEEIIKMKFLDLEKKRPFSSSEFYNFFGFERHNNFIRSFDKKENYSEFYITDEKVNIRTREVYYFSRLLFLKLALKHKTKRDFVISLFLKFKEKFFEKKILKFHDSKRRKIYRDSVNVYEKVSGKFYIYSLNTYNMAIDLDIDPFDLFAFCSKEFCSNFKFGGTGFKNEFPYERKTPIPFIYFDSSKYDERAVFDIFIRKVIKNYSLSEVTKKVLIIYRNTILRLLELQIEYDIKSKRFDNRSNSLKEDILRELTNKEKNDLKLYYRKAAILCHPDRNNGDDELFKRLNNANLNNDLITVKNIYQNLLST